jgi:NTP pyrophosphatase (non-canonical NTP hydrolase)
MGATGEPTRTPDFDELKQQLLRFRDDRDWKQFHDPKNLTEAVAIEAAELLEIFLWRDSTSSVDVAHQKRERIAEEASDIFIFLLYLCEAAGVDLLDAVRRKLLENERKYPVEKVRGKSDKYKEL